MMDVLLNFICETTLKQDWSATDEAGEIFLAQRAETEVEKSITESHFKALKFWRSHVIIHLEAA